MRRVDAQILDRAPSVLGQSLDGANGKQTVFILKSDQPSRRTDEIATIGNLTHQAEATFTLCEAGENVGVQLAAETIELRDSVITQRFRSIRNHFVSFRNGTLQIVPIGKIELHSIPLEVGHTHAGEVYHGQEKCDGKCPASSIIDCVSIMLTMPSLNSDLTYPPLVDRVVVLTGPTASGKSALALEVAERLDGEILSLDSIAVYCGMDIGTAKPSATDRERVRHHMIDLVTPDEDYSVARYLQEAHRIVDDLAANGRKAIFVGGTPMFLKAVLRGFDPGPPPDWDFREAVERDLEHHGPEALRRRLAQVDPLSAAKIDPGDTRRMIRALEVSKSTGRPLSHRQIQFERANAASSCCVFALKWPRNVLHDRINRRVDLMFEQGLIDEVKSLLDRYELSRTALQAVGYREVIEWLQAESRENEIPQSLRESIAAHTRQLARRQETWFRSFTEISFLEASDTFDGSALADEVIRRVEASQP